MGKFTRSYSVLLPAIALLVSLISGVVLLSALTHQLNGLADRQGAQLSQTLAHQLAKAVRDPLIHRDKLSLQVELDEVLTINGVQRAAVYDVNEQLIAEALDPQHGSDSGEHLQRSAVTIETATVGYAAVTLYPSYIAASYTKPLLTVGGIWAVFTLVLGFLAYRMGASLSSRIGNLSRQLPGGDENEHFDELAILAHRLTPLLARPTQSAPLLTAQPIALLGINCRNLARLEALVNREHFEALMTEFDQLIERTLHLYGGQRLHGEHYNVYIEFIGADDEDDQTMNAAYCAAALLRLTNTELNGEGVSMELAAAVTPCISKRSGSTLLDEQAQAQQLKALAELLEKAANGEILLNQSSSQHPAISELDLTPLAENSPFCRINGFGEDGENLLTRQLAVLTHH